MATASVVNISRALLPIISHRTSVYNCLSISLTRNVSSSVSCPTETYDIIIAGGGMVGTTLACKLGKNNKLSRKRILLLEGGPKHKWELKDRYSNRVVALNPSTRKLLDSIGAWEHITDARCTAVKKMQIWDASSDAMITFSHDNLSRDIAYIVENDVLLNAVNRRVQGMSDVVTVIHEAKISGYTLPPRDGAAGSDHVRVEMEDGSTYACKLLIGADGANSQVRKAMGVQYLTWKYNQMGIVATVRLSEPTQNIVAWQRFLKTGPVALLPLTDDLSSLVWSTTTEHAKELLQLSEEGFVDALNEAIWKQYRMDPVVKSATRYMNSLLEAALLGSNTVRQLPPSVVDIEEKSRAAFPLGFGHASRYVGPRVALVGDAAHRVHPLAGQGVNLGFGDVECISEVLGEAVYNGQEIGSLATLWKYESLRQRHNIPTMLAIDGLQKLYGTNFTPLVVLRSVGLQLAHALTPLKKMMMNQASI